MMQLSKNFQLQEFLISQTAERYGINNSPTRQAINNLSQLVTVVLQPLRNKLSAPIIVTSGYRSPKLNARIGGSRFSQHMQGQAADVITTKFNNFEFAKFIVDSGLPFDQLILEYYSGGSSGWVHVSYSTRKLKQILTINSQGTFNGLVKIR